MDGVGVVTIFAYCWDWNVCVGSVDCGLCGKVERDGKEWSGGESWVWEMNSGYDERG